MLWAILLTILYYVVLIKIDTKRKKAYADAKQALIGQTNIVQKQTPSTEALALFGQTNTTTNQLDTNPTATESTAPKKTKPSANNDIKTNPSSSTDSKPTNRIKTDVLANTNNEIKTAPISQEVIESVDMLGQHFIKRQAIDSKIETPNLKK